MSEKAFSHLEMTFYLRNNANYYLVHQTTIDNEVTGLEVMAIHKKNIIFGLVLFKKYR